MSIDIFCLYTAISGNSSFPDIYYLNDTMCVVIKSERRTGNVHKPTLSDVRS